MVFTAPATPHGGQNVALSTDDVAQLARASELLLSPLDYESVDTWRGAVNRQLKTLLHADSAGFLLPVEEGLLLYSEEHDPVELARYQDYPPPPLVDGTPLWEAMVRDRVCTLATLYGKDYELYLNSPYYQEYAGANRAHDTIAAGVSLGGLDARGMASLHLWHERPDGRLFGDREAALLRLLYPAFRAGAEAHFHWRAQHRTLLNTLDALGQCVLVGDVAGKVLHQTTTLTESLARDPEGAAIHDGMLAVLDRVRAAVTASAKSEATVAAPQAVAQLRTSFASYVVRASLYRVPAAATPLVLVALERSSPVPRTATELQSAYGLTKQEVRVARLIAQGRSNAQIADDLIISQHTARRHTERVLLKLSVRSRTEVASKLLC